MLPSLPLLAEAVLQSLQPEQQPEQQQPQEQEQQQPLVQATLVQAALVNQPWELQAVASAVQAALAMEPWEPQACLVPAVLVCLPVQPSRGRTPIL